MSMSANIEKAQEIVIAGINNDLTALTELETLLSNERTALESRDMESIQSFSQRKSELTDTVIKHANQRSEVLKAFGKNNNEDGIFALFEGDPRNELEQSWLQLKEKLEKCQEANLINSKIASRTKNSLSEILKIVQGKSNKQNIYSPAGNTFALTTGNLIGEA